jgi:hypothetical protein
MSIAVSRFTTSSLSKTAGTGKTRQDWVVERENRAIVRLTGFGGTIR